MLRTLLFWAVTLITVPSAHALVVISDVDDTVKITNSANSWQSIWSGVLKNAVFAGMPEVYRAWAADGAKIYFVTGSPSVVGGRMRSMFAYHKIPFASVTLRKYPWYDTYKYKWGAITKLMDRHPTEEVIYVGDDTSKDGIVYRDLAEKYPGRVKAIYIHNVQNKEPLEGQVSWLTSYDIAVSEKEQGRMQKLDLTAFTGVIRKAEKSKLFPKFAYCPDEIDALPIPTAAKSDELSIAVEQTIEAHCAN